MRMRAAVAWAAGTPREVTEVEIAGPQAGEVLVEVMATGLCHTDLHTLSGADPAGIFPAILAHGGAGVVREVGAGVTSVKPGDHLIPLHTPACRQRKTCLSRRSTLCTAIRATQGKGVMPDGSSRLSCKGGPVMHDMGCPTFANFTVLPEIAVAKVRADAPFEKIRCIGCGVTTGVGAVIDTAKVWPDATVAVFGLGGIGRNVIEDARMVGADRTIGVDINPARQEMAGKFGTTDCVNPKEEGEEKVGQEIATRPFQVVTGRVRKGTAFGGARGRTDVPKTVDWHMQGKIDIDSLITHVLPLERINHGFGLMERGESIRSVVVH
jgi:S-(hydroxymethyl)glutathione dehydrogenase/alcohol dehydrogenase